VEHGVDILLAASRDAVERGLLTPEPVLELSCVVFLDSCGACGPGFVELLLCCEGHVFVSDSLIVLFGEGRCVALSEALVVAFLVDFLLECLRGVTALARHLIIVFALPGSRDARACIRPRYRAIAKFSCRGLLTCAETSPG